jgi:hypothetical protein
MDNTQLAKCPVPWCKGPAHLYSEQVTRDSTEWIVRCEDCYVECNEGVYTPEEAAALWNGNRALESAVVEAAKAETAAEDDALLAQSIWEHECDCVQEDGDPMCHHEQAHLEMEQAMLAKYAERRNAVDALLAESQRQGEGEK